MSYKKVKTSTLNLPTLKDLELPKTVKDFLGELSNYDTNIYLIGGFVRDLIAGKLSKDLDFVLIGLNASEFCKNLCLKFDGTCILLDKETGTTRLILKDELSQGYTFDFTSIEENKVEADFARRDFTINALAINLKEPDFIIDYFNGIEDLKSKKINKINLNNLIEDPLRFLRAFRFAAQLNAEISPDIISFIKKNINYFDEKVAGERISTELWKILDCENSFSYIKQMSEAGLLEKIFPELTPMRKVTPNDHHHLYLYDHSIELIKTFEEKFSKIPDWAKDKLEKSVVKIRMCFSRYW